jgi:hypothetical protein
MRRLFASTALVLVAIAAFATPALAAKPQPEPYPWPLATTTPSTNPTEQEVPGTYTACKFDRGVTHCHSMTISPSYFVVTQLPGTDCYESHWEFTTYSRFTAHHGAPGSNGAPATPYFNGGDDVPSTAWVNSTYEKHCA